MEGRSPGEANAGLRRDIEGQIKQFVAQTPLNCYVDIDGSPIFDEPLVGFADGDDALFAEYKTIIGEFHLMPREALHLHASETPSGPFPSVSVISWVLPATLETIRSNADMEVGPSPKWNHMRWYGEAVNDALKEHVVTLLRGLGYAAVAPTLTASFRIVGLANGRASTWSERHAAFAAGLGTFSLSDGLITERGIAMRVGSVVASIDFVPTPRPYTNRTAYCSYLQDGSCGVCIERCPAGAISPEGHDKIKCGQYTETDLKPWVAVRSAQGYTGRYPGCGLCQSGVPCEARVP